MRKRCRRSEIALRGAEGQGKTAFVLDEEKRDKFLKARGSGAPLVDAAGYAGVSVRAIEYALARGREALDTDDPDPIEREFMRFFQAEQKARASFKIVHLANIGNPEYIPKEWQRSAWLLERTDDSFKRYVSVQHSGTILSASLHLHGEMPLVRDLRKLTDEQIEAMNRMMTEARNGKSVDEIVRERR